MRAYAIKGFGTVGSAQAAHHGRPVQVCPHEGIADHVTYDACDLVREAAI